MQPDLISEDRETSRLLVVEVKPSIDERDREFFMQQLRSYASAIGKPKTTYYVLVDSNLIRFYRETEADPKLLNVFKTREALRPYIGETESGTFREVLLAGMTMAWLRDLALHWKEERPPFSDILESDIIDLVSKAGIRVAATP